MEIKITKPAVCAVDTRRRGKPKHQKQPSVKNISTKNSSALYQRKEPYGKKKSAVMNSFGIGSKEVIFKWSMFMGIDTQDIQEKKRGLFHCKHQAQAAFYHLAKCWMLSSF